MYDLAVIGGGPGGYVAAERAASRGLKVVLFERNDMGGVCLNEGCIPTKTLLYSAKLFDYAKHGEKYGVKVSGADVDFAAMMKRKTKTVKKLSGAVRIRMRNAGVELVQAQAFIRGGEEGRFLIEAADTVHEASRILVCAGSSAFLPPIPGLAESGETVVTNREILQLQAVPESLVIIGGGVIGMEFASLFNSLGTRVTVVEMLPKILGPMDDEISSMLQRIYEKKGVEFHLGCKVVAIEGNDVVYEDGTGTVCRASGDRILVSVGRRPNLAGYGLENIGVKTGRGIEVDDKMRTNVPGVWAAGDVTGFSMLAHTASREAEVAVNDICGTVDRMRYNAIPGVVYTNPEVASVGMTEKEAAAAGTEYRVLKLPMAYSGRFVAENEGGEGMCKVLVGKDDVILGVSMIGNPCSEIIHGVCVAMESGMTVGKLKETVFPHPTVSEILRETVFSE